MKVGKSLQQLAAEIERQHSAKRDFLVPTSKALVTADGKFKIGNGDGVEAPISDIAHRQISDYVDVPAKYYDRMRREAPELLASNVNTWFAKKSEQRMVRLLDDRVRAFLSNKYRPLENYDLAQAVLPALQGVEIVSCEVTERRLYIKAVDAKIKFDMPAGAKWGKDHKIFRSNCPAITISNSEIGFGAVSIETGLYDSFCTNLAFFGGHGLRKYHVGGKHELTEGLYAVLTDETRKLTDAAVWHQVRDVVQSAFDEAGFKARCEQVVATQDDKLPAGKVEEVIELTAERFSFSEGERKSVLGHLIEGGDLSRFGLYNAVTRASADVESYDRASELERIGGKIIELPKTDWETLAQAA